MRPAGQAFGEIFGAGPDVRAQAPGRVNLIGEHTDYSGGFVLPLAIPQTCVADLRRLSGRTVRAWSRHFGQDGVVEYTLGRESRRGSWIDYVQGITRTAAERGLALDGFELAIASTVPVGAGLSSSAALSVAVLRALRSAFGWPAEDVVLAQMARQTETGFVGAPVGIMDPMAVSLASTDAALFLDTRSLAWKTVPIPPAVEIGVVDSGVTHRHSAGEYRTRREECDRAAKLAGVAELRDLFDAANWAAVAALPPPLDRRVRHVLAENRRVLDMVQALGAADFGAAGRLLRSSHDSLRNDFEVTIPELDLLVDIASAVAGVYGARMTGGGFGGSIVMLVERGRGAAAAEQVARTYESVTGRPGRVHLPVPAGEAGSPGG